MSDFLFTTRRAAPGELTRILERYLAPVVSGFEEIHGRWGSIAVARAPHDGAAVGGAPDAPSVLIGQPILRRADGVTAVVNGPRPRELLDELLRRGGDPAWDQVLDGPFALLQILVDGAGGRIVSDLAGFIPIFTAEPGTSDGPRLVIGTHLDCVAAAAGCADEIDETSAADLMVNLTCTYPHTLYGGVKQFPPASSRRFRGGGSWTGEPRLHWEPREERAHATLRDAAAALREALSDDVRIACADHEEVGILLSGGEDARTVLAAIPDGNRAHAFVFADWESREVSIARRVARVYGARLSVGWRAADHYAGAMRPVASMVGSGQLFMDVHGYGFHESLGLQALPVVLGGLSADAFLKGAHAPARSAAGIVRLPPGGPIRQELLEAVAARRTGHRDRLREIRPDSAAEWEKLWPFSMRVHAANFHGNRRLFASHEPFHANALVKLAAATPASWKRRRALFHRAVRPLLATSWYIPHSRWHFPHFGAIANLPLSAGLRVTRGAMAVARGQVRSSHGPWPKWQRVVRLPAVAREQAEHAVWDSPLRSVFAADSPARLASQVREDWHPLRELMLLQLSYLARKAAGAE